MTTGDIVEGRSQDFLSDEEDREEQKRRPFHIVLVDIKEAVRGRIQCIETPLETEGLEFVAISYRWGELQETIIDTHVGYLANISSFALYNFYELCAMMTHDIDLQFIQYVWVDAICVDQTNLERRKSTIYHMSNIYKRAKYIVAVPDLHKQHLINVSTANSEIVGSIRDNAHYIYYLIQGKTDQLVELDNEFLDTIHVPKDPKLRHWLKKYTDCFAHAFTTSRPIDKQYDYMKILDHIYEASQASCAPHTHQGVIGDGMNHHHEKSRTPMENDTTTAAGSNDDASFEQGFRPHCNHITCPLTSLEEEGLLTTNGPLHKLEKSWRQLIYERSINIRRGLKFFSDLILDWSTRVWVISEYDIAKKKNNLKYWFIGLAGYEHKFPKDFAFFKFDFHRPAFFHDVQSYRSSFGGVIRRMPFHLIIHDTMIRQLNTQTFFEMLLKSNASKNEDRFYAILPLSKYKDKVSQVHHWKINAIISVKLKLFEIMDTKDKLNLLFMSGNRCIANRFETLPTFATSTIDWQQSTLDFFTLGNACNFDLNNPSVITFHGYDHRYSNCRYSNCYLQLTPKEYHVHYDPRTYLWPLITTAQRTNLFVNAQFDNALGDDHGFTMDIVSIPSFDAKTIVEDRSKEDIYYRIYLIGSFKENKWLLCRFSAEFDKPQWDHHFNDDNAIFFNIY